jgi:hypothetical protein
VTPRNMEYTKYDPPSTQVSNDALAQKYLLYTPPSQLKHKIKVSTGVFLHTDAGNSIGEFWGGYRCFNENKYCIIAGQRYVMTSGLIFAFVQ